MLEAFISGKLRGIIRMRDPVRGPMYFTLQSHTPKGEPVTVNVCTFVKNVMLKLLSAVDGDPMALVGSFKPSAVMTTAGQLLPQIDLEASRVMVMEKAA